MLQRISKNGEEITKTISHKLKSIDSAKSMARALSNLVNNLGDIIHKIKCKCRQDNKKCKTCGSKYKNFECYLKCRNIKDDLIVWKCLYCNGNHQKKLDENLKQKFGNTYTFSNHDMNKFILLFQKGGYPMNTWMTGKIITRK